MLLCIEEVCQRYEMHLYESGRRSSPNGSKVVVIRCVSVCIDRVCYCVLRKCVSVR